jgi:hypothetical protein
MKKKEKGKETLTSIADSAAREGCSLVPGGGLAYDAVKSLVTYGKRYFAERNDRRLEDFYKGLLTGEGGKVESEEYLNRSYSLDDYYSVLKGMLQDEEDEKVYFYSSLMKSIIEGTLNGNEKKFFIKTLRELSEYDLATIQEFYVLANYELTDNGDALDQVRQFCESASPLARASIANLVRLGYLEAKDDFYIPTPLLEGLANAIFPPEKIAPAAIEKQELSHVDIFVATFVDNATLSENNMRYGPEQRNDAAVKRYSGIMSALAESIKKTGKSFVIANPRRFTQAQKSARLILLCLDRFENPMILYSWNKDLLSPEKVFKVLLDTLKDGRPYDTIPGTEAARTIDLTDADKGAFDALEARIREYFCHPRCLTKKCSGRKKLRR